ncbi:MAG: pyrroline-5-carboxylate reductase [Anaerolineaceae bacterium]|nr:pyrroline-5-carboxylate reductase [Anaerolineaceae bacterium]
MDTKIKIALIGSGVMGEAFIAGILKNQLAESKQIFVSDPLESRRKVMYERYGVGTDPDNAAIASQADVVIMAMKPQQLNRVLRDLKDKIRPDTLVLSIVAGATIDSISEGLNHLNVVRIMPNTPAQIGEGISVWTISASVSKEQAELARKILGALGDEVFMEDEYYLDMATALSGTGPAYAFLFMEAMIDAGVHLGFPRYISEKLVTQTVRGSVNYYSMKKDHPAALRNEVTSPGGTSAAALYYLEKAGFRTAISRAVWAAFERSQELGKGRKSQPPDNNG